MLKSPRMSISLFTESVLLILSFSTAEKASSLDSQMPMTAALVIFAISRSSSILDNKLLMLRRIKCRSLILKTFHSFEHCIVFWWIGPVFKLILPESNNSKWENKSKFWYLSFEIE